MNVPIEIREMRRLHAIKTEYEHQESVTEFQSLLNRIRLATKQKRAKWKK